MLSAKWGPFCSDSNVLRKPWEDFIIGYANVDLFDPRFRTTWHISTAYLHLIHTNVSHWNGSLVEQDWLDLKWSWGWIWNSGVGVGIGVEISGVGIGVGVETSGVGVGVGVDILEIGRSWSWSWNSRSWSWSWSWYYGDWPELELELELKPLELELELSWYYGVDPNPVLVTRQILKFDG